MHMCCLSALALIGRHGALAQSNYVEEDEEEDGGNTFDESESGAGTLTPSSKLALGSSYDISDWSVENFLPSGIVVIYSYILQLFLTVFCS